MTKREAKAIGAALWEGIANGEDPDTADRILWNTCLCIIDTTGMVPAHAAAMGMLAGLSGSEADRLAAHAHAMQIQRASGIKP